MTNKFKLLSLVMVLSMVLTACGGSTEPIEVVESDSEVVNDVFRYDLGESMDELLFESYSGNYVVPCLEGWVCNEEYGGSITHVETYNSVLFYDVYGEDADSLLRANEDLLMVIGNREITETSEWQEGAMASLVTDLDTGNQYWVTVFDIGFDGALLKCQGNFEAGTFDDTISEVQAICASARLQ